MRIAVVSFDGTPLSPTTPAKARKLLRSGGAVARRNREDIFYLRLTTPTGTTVPHNTVVGVDPGKNYTGMAVQTPQATLWLGHLILPFPVVRAAMTTRHTLRHGRRYRHTPSRPQRAFHRTKCKIPPSIRGSRDLEWRVLCDLAEIYPITHVIYEEVKARSNKSFAPVMNGQRWQMARIAARWPVTTPRGYDTAFMRKHLGLAKTSRKSETSPASHAVDGVALAATHFLRYMPFYEKSGDHGRHWEGACRITDAPFAVIRRPLWLRRALHTANPQAGRQRPRHGGTTTPWGFRKADYVEATKAGQTVRGWIGGYTNTAKTRKLSVVDARWKRLGQYTVSKVRLLARASRIVVAGIPTITLRYQ